MKKVRKYVPLDVKSWREGRLRTRGWMCVSILSMLTGLLFVGYELMYINVEDRDFRDMLYDFRVGSQAMNYYHKHFVNDMFCCNFDPVVFPYSSICRSSYESLYPGQPTGFSQLQANQYSTDGPYCPPIVTFTCSDFTSAACNTTRTAVYTALNMDSQGNPLVPGLPIPAHVIAQLTSLDASSIRITVTWNVSRYFSSLTFSSPNDIDPSAIAARVQDIRTAFNSELVPLKAPMDRSLTINGMNIDFASQTTRRGSNLREYPPWPADLWPWPLDASPCSKTSTNPQWFMDGNITLLNPGLSIDRILSHTAEIKFSGQVSEVPVFELHALDKGRMRVRVLSALTVYIGKVATGNPTSSWIISHVDAVYKDVSTAQEGDRQLLTDAQGSLPTSVSVTLRDVSGPVRPALPAYKGAIAVFVGICMGGVWVFSSGLFILIVIPLIYVNVRRNSGGPPLFYMWSAKWRGW